MLSIFKNVEAQLTDFKKWKWEWEVKEWRESHIVDFTKEDTSHTALRESKHRGLSILTTRRHFISFTRKIKIPIQLWQERNQKFKLQKEAQNKIFQNSCLSKAKFKIAVSYTGQSLDLLYNLFFPLLLTHKQVKHSKIFNSRKSHMFQQSSKFKRARRKAGKIHLTSCWNPLDHTRKSPKISLEYPLGLHFLQQNMMLLT